MRSLTDVTRDRRRAGWIVAGLRTPAPRRGLSAWAGRVGATARLRSYTVPDTSFRSDNVKPVEVWITGVGSLPDRSPVLRPLRPNPNRHSGAHGRHLRGWPENYERRTKTQPGGHRAVQRAGGRPHRPDPRTAGSSALCGALLASLHVVLQRSGSMDRPSLTHRP
jgi:hypothetical protein